MSTEYLIAARSAVKSKSKSIIIQSTPEKVFSYMDDLSNSGMHMMESSAMMMGSKLNLEQLSENSNGLFARFRWLGKMMGIPIDFTTVVTQWIKDKAKIWETVGESKMIILKWYRMNLVIIPLPDGYAEANLSIEYSLPDNFILHAIGFLLAPWYANWCLNSMLKDSKDHLENFSLNK